MENKSYLVKRLQLRRTHAQQSWDFVLADKMLDIEMISDPHWKEEDNNDIAVINKHFGKQVQYYDDQINELNGIKLTKDTTPQIDV